ncbi:Extracellular exo-alpha-(1-_5)-L-arabinofuranosidase ArbA [Gracilariopsis chorda]|uniref:Endo-1,5-alpha-L-arabinanase A n=1 Tax=Gracilariopsis chorda TaxID=448386 RepID=A0A2V3J054_9FLOR|nr:Extracellular exo-alpha-(1->5)-L-arabinofuranosidase ArbA [Gracilariopsis chorda]|eukprot:PXF47729.1 Extracellular exo-alpha-(1-_5)-L-arabinofuranosidase ArbA [Gracilariopsis chorda]
MRFHHAKMSITLLLFTFLVTLAPHQVQAADESLRQHYDEMDIPIQSEDYVIHDPSRVITKGEKQMIAVTGKAQEDGYSCGLETWYRTNYSASWKPGQCLFKNKPHWIEDLFDYQDGAYWAPELVKPRVMFYSVADFSDRSSITCVGLARAKGPFPNKLTWTDSGRPTSCVDKEDFEEEVSAIDPTTLTDENGTVYLITGGGIIHGTELNKRYEPVSGEWFSPGFKSWTQLARGPKSDDGYGWVEAAYAHYRGGWYYLFVNWGGCCQGIDSTYNIRVGRSRNPLGPYEDKNGKDMLYGGGSLFLRSRKFMIGPGHTSIHKDPHGDVFCFHYYDKRREGAAWIAERRLRWAKSGWPVVGKVLSS